MMPHITEKSLKKALDEVRLNTKYNDHNGAIVIIAEYVFSKNRNTDTLNSMFREANARDLLVACESLKALHRFYGYMPEHLLKLREDLKNRCFSYLSEDEKSAFNNVL
jgi:hypothetical protein